MEDIILCGSNYYEQKYYLNPDFSGLPEDVKKELNIMCVLFTEDVGGILTLQYDVEGNLMFITMSDEGDLLYDEIGSALKIKQYQEEKKDLLEQLETYYKVFFLGETID